MKRHLAWFTLLACSSAAAPSQLERWLEEWEATRACLVGAIEPADGPAGALAARSLMGTACFAPPPPELAAADAELASIWQRANEAVQQLVDPDSIAGPRRRSIDEQILLLEAIDGDVAELRERAGLPAAFRPIGAALPKLGPGVLFDELDPAAAEIVRDTASRGGLWGWLSVRDDKPASPPAVIDDRARPELVDVREWAEGSAVVDGSRKLVLLSKDSQYALAASDDGGARWQLIRDGARLVDTARDRQTGAIELLLRDDAGARLVRIAPADLAATIASSRPPGGVVFAPGDVDTRWTIACRAGDTVWALGGGLLVRIDLDTGGVRSHTLVPRGRYEVDCDRETAITIDRLGYTVDRCADGRCATVFERAHWPEAASSLLPDGSWLHATTAADVVAIWRDGHGPTFHRLAIRGEVHGIVVIRGIAHLAVQTFEGQRFVPIASAAK
jgi:hypothetical protein